MGEIVNLRRARKQKSRSANERAAAENRVSFGTPKAIRTVGAKRKAITDKALDGHRREPSETGIPDISSDDQTAQ